MELMMFFMYIMLRLDVCFRQRLSVRLFHRPGYIITADFNPEGGKCTENVSYSYRWLSVPALDPSLVHLSQLWDLVILTNAELFSHDINVHINLRLFLYPQF